MSTTQLASDQPQPTDDSFRTFFQRFPTFSKRISQRTSFRELKVYVQFPKLSTYVLNAYGPLAAKNGQAILGIFARLSTHVASLLDLVLPAEDVPNIKE